MFAQKQDFDKVSLKIQNVVREIALTNTLCLYEYDVSRNKNVQYERFKKLQKDVTIPELIELTKHKNEVVRCYAFLDLISKDTIKAYDILLIHLNDTDYVCSGGDVHVIEMVGDFYLSIAMSLHWMKVNFSLSKIQKEHIYDLLFEDETNSLNFKQYLLSSVKFSEIRYEQIRRIAITTKTPESILAL